MIDRIRFAQTLKEYNIELTEKNILNPDINKRVEYDLKCVTEIDNTLEEICNKEEINYIKINHLIDNDLLVDGLHPNSIGHEKISEEVLKAIKQ